MKTWRKALALLLSMLMTSALLMGCGSSGGSSGAASGSPAASSSTGGSSGETITFRVSQSKSAAHPYQKGVEMFAELVKENTATNLFLTSIPTVSWATTLRCWKPASWARSTSL